MAGLFLLTKECTVRHGLCQMAEAGLSIATEPANAGLEGTTSSQGQKSRGHTRAPAR
jgi:hypothetical protein